MIGRADRLWTGNVRPEWTVTVVPNNPADARSIPLEDLDEPALVQACLTGRPGAFDRLVERHQRDIYRLCYRFVGNHEDASDLAQEVFLRSFHGLKHFKGHSSLATWLYRIGVNVCLSRVRSKLPLLEPLDAHPHVDTRAEDPAASLIRAERAAEVRAAIDRLPRTQRATLILRVYHELPHRDIAQILGSSVGAVKANFFHALSNLKKLLGQGREASKR